MTTEFETWIKTAKLHPAFEQINKLINLGFELATTAQFGAQKLQAAADAYMEAFRQYAKLIDLEGRGERRRRDESA